MKAAAALCAAAASLLFFAFPLTTSAAVHLAEPNMNALTTGLVGYWPLDGATTNWTTDTTADMSGNGNTGTLINMSTTTSPTAGKIGGALNFNGSSSTICGSSNSTSLDLTGAMTIGAWIYPTGFGGNNRGRIFDRETSSAGYMLMLDNANTTAGLGFGVNAALTTGATNTNYVYTGSNTVTLGEWQYVTVTYDGAGHVQFYVDGIPYAADRTLVQTPLNSAGITPCIGSSNATANRLFPGKIDDVRVYDRALSPQEVALLYATGQVNITAQSLQGGLSGSLAASWSFDSSTVSGTTVYDQSGNGHNLTLENGASIAPGYSGDALTLDGADDQYAAGEVGTLPTSVALSMWVKASSVSTEQSILVEQDSETANTGYHFTLVGIKNGAFYAGFWDIGDIASTPISANTWYHVILTYDGVADTQSLYVNGVLQGTQSGTWSPPSTIYFLPGLAQQGCSFTSASGYCDDTANYFTGQIDDLQAYDQAFTAADVQSLNNLTLNIAHSNTSPNIGINSGLVGYWTFDGPTINWRTDTVADMSGQGNTGTLENISTSTSSSGPVAGKIGQALLFDGSASWVSVPNSSSLNPGTGSFTVSAWVKEKTCVPSMVIAAKSAGGGASASYGWHFAVFGSSCTPELHYATSGAFTTIANSNGLSPGTWYHVVAVVDRNNSGNDLIYINGNPAGSSVSGFGSNTGAVSNTEPFAIGSESDTGFNWSGTIDDVRVYNRALSPQEVQQLYVSGGGGGGSGSGGVDTNPAA